MVGTAKKTRIRGAQLSNKNAQTGKLTRGGFAELTLEGAINAGFFNGDAEDKKRKKGADTGPDVPFLPNGFMPPEYQDDFPMEEAPILNRKKRRRGGKKARARRELQAQQLEDAIPRFARVLATGVRACGCCDEQLEAVEIYCIGWKESEKRSFNKCACDDWGSRLLHEGYFPATPVRPEVAYSMELLNFWRWQHHTSHPTKEGFVVGLRGFHREILRREVRDYKESFRRIVPFWLRSTMLSVDTRGILMAAACEQDLCLALLSGTLAERCPADFYLEECAYKTYPIIIGIDGNQQHWRGKNASANDGNIPEYKCKLFKHVPKEDREVADIPMPNTEVCSHNFRAASTMKPVTMRKCDETGLLAVVCRHDVPLKLMNTYAGEKFHWVVRLLETFLEDYRKETSMKNDCILLYDVACRMHPYITANHGELAKRITCVVNKFHGLAHELRCQKLYSVIAQPNAGRSDGEGTERVWSGLSPLVSAGRESTAANRCLHIEDHCDYIKKSKRHSLGSILRGRYLDALKDSQKQEARLMGILRTMAKGRGGKEEVITFALLESEFANQQEYFQKTKARKIKPNLTIYNALLAEDHAARKIAILNTSYEDGDVTNVEHTIQLQEATETRDARIAATDELMKKHKQTRDEWRRDGLLWRRAVKLTHPDRDVYESLMAERMAQGQSKEMGKRLHAQKMATLTAATNACLLKNNQTRKDWDSKGKLWNSYHLEIQIEKLEEIYGEILTSAAARALELRNLKARCYGNKEAKRILKGILSRYPAIEKKIVEFNTLSQELPLEHRPPLLLKDAFLRVSGTEGTGVDQDGAEALWFLESLRTDLLNTDRAVPTSFWPFCARVRNGIDAMHRRDRAVEEMDLVKIEWERLVRFTTKRFRGILDCVHVPIQGFNKDVFLAYMWDEMQGLENIIKAADKLGMADDGAFQSHELSNLLGIARILFAQSATDIAEDGLAEEEDQDDVGGGADSGDDDDDGADSGDEYGDGLDEGFFADFLEKMALEGAALDN